MKTKTTKPRGKRILALFLTLLTVLAVLPTNLAFAASTTSSIYAGGSGKADDPWQIKTLEQLEAFRDAVKSKSRYSNGKYFKLTADIDMSSKYGKGKGENGADVSWSPIGDWESRNSFSGVFDGDGYRITGVYVKSSNQCQGLFGYASGATIKNLGVSGEISGGDWVGGLVGYNSDSTIENCYSECSVSGSDMVGGMVGYNTDGEITLCCNEGSVSGSQMIGGLVGYNSNGEITLCCNEGSVSGSKYIGGVVGENCKVVKECYNTGQITGSTSTYDYKDVGGVVGYNTSKGTVENCYNSGSVSGRTQVGGIVGEDGGTIAYCYNAGNVSGWNSDVGGIVGYYPSGSTGAATNCYYLDGTANKGGESGCSAITQEQLKETEAFSGWDFNTVWIMEDGHPMLRSTPEETGSEFSPYIIKTLAELENFRNEVNNGNNFSGEFVKLMANIDMSDTYGEGMGEDGSDVFWTPIGISDTNYFKGTFDGNGKTVSGMKLKATGNNQGFFGVVSGGTVKNLNVRGDISVVATAENSVHNVGGVVGLAKGSLTLEDIHSYVNIKGQDEVDSGQKQRIGGVVGGAGDGISVTLNRCVYEGTIDLKLAQRIGGVIGHAENGTLSYCDNKGTVTADGDSHHVGGVAGDATNGMTLTCCMNYGAVTSGGNDCVGGVVAYAFKNNHFINCANVGTVKCTSSAGGFIGGVLGYINQKESGSMKNCYNYGTIVSNAGESNHSGAVVGWCRNATMSGFNNNYYLNTSCERDSDGNSIGATALTKEQFEQGLAAYLLNGRANGIWKQTIGTDAYPNFTGANVYPVLDATGAATGGINNVEIPVDDNGVYQISTLAQLLRFADRVNGGETALNAKLMNDVDASAANAIGIGSAANAYSGTFDGDGHTLKVALNNTEQYTAPFVYIKNATIKNLKTDGTVATSAKFAAGLIARADETVTVEGCTSSVVINSSVNGDGTHGGLVAVMGSGTLTIKNCGFSGAINGTATTYCGGLVGWTEGATTIDNSFVSASFTVQNNNIIARNPGKVTITNCYYLNKQSDDPTGATQKTAREFASGEVAWLLNGNATEGAWGQLIGSDAIPVLGGAKVYESVGEPKIYHNSLPGFKILGLGADNKSANIAFNDMGSYTVVFAHYEDEKLVNVAIRNDVNVSRNLICNVSSDADFTLTQGDKIMLFSSASSLQPLCSAFVVPKY